MAQIRTDGRAIRRSALIQNIALINRPLGLTHGCHCFCWKHHTGVKCYVSSHIDDRQRHGRSLVARGVAHAVAHGLARYFWPECLSWLRALALSAFQPGLKPMMLRKDAPGLRALGLKPASLLRTATASLPAPRSRRAPAGQGQNQKQRGALDRPPKRCERSLWSGISCACAPAPDRRHSPSLRSVATMSAVRRASRSKRITRSVALGSAPSLAARWDSLLLLSRPFQSALGRFLHLAPPGGGSSLFSGPVGACANFAKPAKFLQHSLPFARALSALRTARAACARPNSRRGFLPARCMPSWYAAQTVLNQHANLFKGVISHHGTY
jgi:hypothetical protein